MCINFFLIQQFLRFANQQPTTNKLEPKQRLRHEPSISIAAKNFLLTIRFPILFKSSQYMNSAKDRRLFVLSDEEISELYDRPVFDLADRRDKFSIDELTAELVSKMRKLDTKVALVLLIGYFRKKPVVSRFSFIEAQEDVEYICDTHFPGEGYPISVISDNTFSPLIKQMLEIVGVSQYRRKDHYQKLMDRLKDTATIRAEPLYLFDECLAFCNQERIALPGYTTLQDMVTDALVYERKRIERILKCHLTEGTREQLRNLISTRGAISKLASIKRTAKDFSFAEVESEIVTHKSIGTIYPEIKVLVESLQLSQGNLTYYASMIRHRSISQLREYIESQSHLYLACYLYFRYRETNDNLLTTFRYNARKQKQAAEQYSKKRLSENIEVVRDKLQLAGSLLNLFVDDSYNDAVEFGEIRKAAYSIISKKEIKTISQHLGENDYDTNEYSWQYVDNHHRKITNALRKVFISMDIHCDPPNSILAKQIESAKTELTTLGRIQTIDKRIIAPKDRPYLQQEDITDHKRFEYYLYRKILSRITANEIYVTESEQSKRLEDDLISSDEWINKEDLVQKAGLSRLNTSISHTLVEFTERIDLQLGIVSNRVQNDKNEFIKHIPNQDKLAFSVASKKWKDDVDNPIYNQVEHLSIIEVMDFVNKRTKYLKEFDNISPKRKGFIASDEDLVACIFGNGANYGLYNMSKASDRDIGVLRNVNESYLRTDTLKRANDVVANAISRLPIYRHYTINEGALFASMDGQKHNCRTNTWKARFSSKYFRSGRGVSALSLVCNHVPVITEMMAPNEYEGHYAFDLLFNNTSEIQPQTLSTDGHGINHVNFAILDINGYTFAPRYPNFKRVFLDMFEVNYQDDLKFSLKNPIKT